jgi:hypothetical protein
LTLPLFLAYCLLPTAYCLLLHKKSYCHAPCTFITFIDKKIQNESCCLMVEKFFFFLYYFILKKNLKIIEEV